MDQSCVECGHEDEWNFAIYNTQTGEVHWVCQKHGQDGLEGDVAAEFLPDGRVVAVERSETDTCEAGTPGCCVRHKGPADGCETW